MKHIYEAVTINGKIPAKRCTYEFLLKFFTDEKIISTIREYQSLYLPREFLTLCKHDLTEPGMCRICGKPCMFVFGDRGVSDYCSSYCANRDSERIKKQIRDSYIDPIRVAAITEKRKVTMQAKYGCDFNYQREEVMTKLKKSKLKPEHAVLLSNREWMIDQYVTQKKTFEQIYKDFGIDKGQFGLWLHRHEISPNYGSSISLGQKEIAAYIESLGFEVKISDRTLLPNKREFDIFVPDRNLAIEFDGLYWHSFDHKPSVEETKLHLDKVLEAEKVGIQLIRFTDMEWSEQTNLIKSMICSKLGVTEKIYARKCSIRFIENKDTKEFLEYNHLQGHTNAKHSVGLYSGEELVSVLSFGKSRFDKQYEWELLRFASKSGYSIIGGFSRMLKYFREQNSGSILTYADRKISNGNVYVINGFTRIGLSQPGYFWLKGSVVYSRYQTQKHLLAKLLKNFDASKSEVQNMLANKFRLYYNCGNIKFVLN